MTAAGRVPWAVPRTRATAGIRISQTAASLRESRDVFLCPGLVFGGGAFVPLQTGWLDGVPSSEPVVKM